MSSRTLIFGSLAAMVVLVGALIFATTGDPPVEARAAVPAPRDAPAMTAAPGDDPAADLRDEADDVAGDDDAEARSGGDHSGDHSGTAADRTVEPAATPAPAPAPAAEPTTEARPAAQDPDTDAILRATARRYEDVRALQADFRQEIHNPLLGTRVTSRGSLYQRQPDRFLMRFSDPEGDVIVSDGEYFWMYFPSTDARQVIRTRRGAQGLDLRSQFVGDPVRRFDATYEGRDDVAGRSAHVLSLEPREALGYRRLKVWIDANDHLVRRFELTEENGLVRHFVLSELRINPTLGDQLFRFTPPENARIVDRG